MGKHVLNVDEWLRENEVEIVLGGKTYVVKDIPLEVEEMLRAERPDYVKIVAKLLGAPEEEVRRYGVAALAKVVRFVSENLLEPISPEVQ